MDDLRLYRLLVASETPADLLELTRLLRLLASREPEARRPWIGYVPTYATHGDASVRAAAISALAGATGRVGVAMIVHALDDGDASVRAEAARALLATATSQPHRIAHLVFHPRPDVRRVMHAAKLSPKMRAIAAHRLADPAFDGDLASLELAATPASIGLVVNLALRARLTKNAASAWLKEGPASAQVSWANAAPRRSSGDVARTLESEGTDIAGADRLDALFGLFGLDVSAVDRARLYDVRWTNFARPLPAPMRRRILAALVCANAGQWSAEALGLAVFLDARVLTWKRIPLVLRRAATDALYRHPDPSPVPAAQLTRLMSSDLVRRHGGDLDLRVAGALSLFHRKGRYAWLVEHLGLESIRRAFLRDPEASAPFLSLHDSGEEGRAWMIDRMLEGAGTQGALIYAVAATSRETGDLAFLDTAPDAMRLEIVTHLFAFEHRPGLAFGASHALTLARTLVDVMGVRAEVLTLWLERGDHAASNLGPELVRRMGDDVDAGVLAALVAQLPTKLLRRALDVFDTRDTLTFAQQYALADELAEHGSAHVARWAQDRRPRSVTTGAFEPSREVHDLSEAQANAIATETDLDAAIQAAQGRSVRGVVAALRRRAEEPRASVEVAVALLGCADEPLVVAEAFAERVELSSTFIEALDARALEVAARHPNPPLLLRCWLWRFERHGLAAGATMVASDGGLTASLRFASSLPSTLLVEHGWAAAARTVTVWRLRDPERLAPLADGLDALLDLAIEHLDRAEGVHAARLILALHEARLDPIAVPRRVPELRSRLPDMADETRSMLRVLVSSRGLGSRATGARAGQGHASRDALARVRACSDLDTLTRLCGEEVLAVVHEAALRLVEIGELGQRRLAWHLAQSPLPTHFEAITASLPLWAEGDALDAVRFSLTQPGPPELRFRIALGLLERGDDTLDAAVDATLVPGRMRWLKRSDVEELVGLAPDARRLMHRLVGSHHPSAYLRAVRFLKSRLDPTADDIDALRRFLFAGSERMLELRLEVAELLLKEGDTTGLVLLIAAGLDGHPVPEALSQAPESLVLATVQSTLICARASDDGVLFAWLDAVDATLRERCLTRLLTEAQSTPTRSAAISRLPRRPQRAHKLRALAEMFAWGADVSRELTGGTLRPVMMSGEGLGFTQLNEDRVFVSPLPFLRGERHGREIVEGLILHEIGHHRHHKGVEAHAVWTKATQIGLGWLLNLVADEHLERNLRAFDADYGHKLKRLGAYAFQHARRDVQVDVLLASLSASAFDVLSASRLDVATNPRALRIGTASILRELERGGSSFARFARAMRMGLGDRHDDARVREGLALFPRSFKTFDMRALLRVTRELHRIFGDEVQLSFAFGGSESIEVDPFDDITHGDQISDVDVQREVERIQGKPDGSRSGGRGRGRLQINVGADEDFDPIHEIIRVAPDPKSHRAVAIGVARHARRLRALLTNLGLSLEPQRMRLRGRRLDRTRLRALVTRGDPRVLVAREARFDNDLFLGLVIDCSGSMMGPSMQRAHAFGVLLSEAVRGLPGVDLRIFGFTDHEIFDAGDARRPAVTALKPGGGNNDAAGLWHAAQEAMRSRRKAKVLVMISDGLPTECSVATLRNLVHRLSRRHGLVCAQVAVRPLEEVCFPHYIEIDEANLDGAVARFGKIVARLVGRTLRTS